MEIRKAVLAMLSRCDGAGAKDNVGFNKFDANFARDIVNSAWTVPVQKAALRMLRKYRGQLSDLGINYDALQIDSAYSYTAPSVLVMGTVVGESDLAVKILVMNGTTASEQWFPKSQLEKEIRISQNLILVQVPGWLAQQKSIRKLTLSMVRTYLQVRLSLSQGVEV